MKVKKGTLINIDHRRKGRFVGRATDDFDTEIDEFYPICVHDKTVKGLSNVWEASKHIPCRASLCTIEPIS